MYVKIMELNKNFVVLEIENIKETEVVMPTETIPIGAAAYEANIKNTKRKVTTTIWFHEPDKERFDFNQELQDSVWKEMKDVK